MGDEGIREIALKIFNEGLTWKDARFEYGVKIVDGNTVPAIAEKTLRNKVMQLCQTDPEVAKSFSKYSTTKKQKRTNVNVPAVIIAMIQNSISLSEMAQWLNQKYNINITKDTLKTLVKNEIKKTDNEILAELLKSHNSRMKSKDTMLTSSEFSRIASSVDLYIEEHPDYTEELVSEKDVIESEIERIKSLLAEIEHLKSTGMSENQICKLKGWGHEQIKRQRRYLKNYELIIANHKNNPSIQSSAENLVKIPAGGSTEDPGNR